MKIGDYVLYHPDKEYFISKNPEDGHVVARVIDPCRRLAMMCARTKGLGYDEAFKISLLSPATKMLTINDIDYLLQNCKNLFLQEILAGDAKFWLQNRCGEYAFYFSYIQDDMVNVSLCSRAKMDLQLLLELGKMGL